jgi:RNA polymerase sigma-70 factor (TIGR02954 family)
MEVESLVIAAQNGDDDAFFKLISSIKEKMYHTAYCYLKNENDALEAVQETTCKAYVKLKSLKEPKYFNTWVTRILINFCIDEIKRKKKFVYLEDEKISEGKEQNADYIEILNLLDRMEPKYKKIIILKYIEDLTIHDIAEIMDCPEGTVKTWTSRALNQLRNLINAGGGLNV